MEPQLKAEIRFLTTRLGHMIREQAGERNRVRDEEHRVIRSWASIRGYAEFRQWL